MQHACGPRVNIQARSEVSYNKKEKENLRPTLPTYTTITLGYKLLE